MMRAGIDYLTKALAHRRIGPQPFVIPAAIYDMAKAEGVIDMTPYVRQEPTPAAPER